MTLTTENLSTVFNIAGGVLAATAAAAAIGDLILTSLGVTFGGPELLQSWGKFATDLTTGNINISRDILKIITVGAAPIGIRLLFKGEDLAIELPRPVSLRPRWLRRLMDRTATPPAPRLNNR